MSQPKVFEFAKEVGLEPLALMDKIRKWKLPVKSHMAVLEEDLIVKIRGHLEAEAEAAGAKKKKTTTKKKTAAKKKTVAKKTATKKKTVAKKAVTKKTVTKKTVAKKATAAAGETTAKKKVTKKKAAAAKPVIRRKAAHAPETVRAAAEAQAAEEAKKAAEAAAAAAAVEASAEETESEPADAPKKTRGNIVGRMELKPSATAGKKERDGGAPGGSRNVRPSATGPRNIRAGFVAAPGPAMGAPDMSEESQRKAREEKKKKAGAGAGAKESEAPAFIAADFRKREVIFQPKKKRMVTTKLDNKKTQITMPAAHKRVVKIHENIKVSELAQQLGIKVPQLIKKLVAEGVMANMNTALDFDTVALLAPEFNFQAENTHTSVEDQLVSAAFGELDAEPVSRPPVVTVMGHVDHGKTTLLDAIRKANVVDGEAGGITQHIGAYKVKLDEGKVTTFIDTPGHAAFTAMRARGAHVTDIVIVVVAADDGVMPQTEEAISHAKAANVPIIVAVNKMDKEGANPDKIKQQLTEYELVPEEWGGDTIFCNVSALKKEGITELLEQVHLVAEVQELKANPKRSASGVVIEARMEKGRGHVATVLIQEGTLEKGHYFVAGKVSGRIRNMMNDQGQIVKVAEPGDPVEITGLEDSPSAGDSFNVTKDEGLAQEVAASRKASEGMEEVPNSGMSLDSIFAKVQKGDLQELPVVLKSDVAGSNEAIKGMFEKLNTDEVKVKVIHTGVGGVSESDVLLAATAGGIIIGFNVRPDGAAQRLAKEKAIEIKSYNIIYNLVDDVKQAMAGLLSPDEVEKSQGRAEVRDTFSVPKMGMIAGCSVLDGKINRNDQLRLVRDGKIVYEGKVGSLRRFKDDVKEVATGYECGIGIENFNDIKVGDIIESFVIEEVAREL